MNISLEKGSGEGLSTILVEQEEAINPFLAKLAISCKVLDIQTYEVDFLTPELQE
jgi:hypothetical protein